MSEPQRKPNASERIANLETALMQLYQTCNNMASDLQTSKEAIKLLGNKCEALRKATGISDEDIASLMIENNVAELKEKCDNLVTQGILTSADTVSETSFVVGKESDDDGKVVNPRLQFAMNAVNEEVRSKIVGSKVGQILTLQEGKLKFEVSEIYTISVPTQEEAPVEAAPVAEEAPVAESSAQ